ncbi:MAG: RNA polymerase sigma factor [Pseudomonadales bacterium]
MYEEDKALVKGLLKGAEQSFNAFFELYYPRTFRFCQRRVPEQDAEDIAMKTINQAMRRIETYRGEASLMTWIYQIARSQLSSHFRESSRKMPLVLIEDSESLRQEVAAMAGDIANTPESATAQAQHQHMIHSMLDALPNHYGDLLEMKYIEGLSVPEIAERIGSSDVSVQSALARARRSFKTSYEKIQRGVSELARPDFPEAQGETS